LEKNRQKGWGIRSPFSHFTTEVDPATIFFTSFVAESAPGPD
jgi:hypothetical protein